MILNWRFGEGRGGKGDGTGRRGGVAIKNCSFGVKFDSELDRSLSRCDLHSYFISHPPP